MTEDFAFYPEELFKNEFLLSHLDEQMLEWKEQNQLQGDQLRDTYGDSK